MPNQDAISRRWFDAATVTVVVEPNVPPIFNAQDYIGLSGALSHSRVHVKFEGGFVQMEVANPAVRRMIRRIVYDLESAVYRVWNAKLVIRPEFWGQDLAARSITVQARAAKDLKFSRLSAYAEGDVTTATATNPNERWSGYYVWPRLGFNAAIPEDVLGKLPQGLWHATTLAHLMETPAGQNFWYEHGHGISVDFDLTADSISWQTLMCYTTEKQIGI